MTLTITSSPAGVIHESSARVPPMTSNSQQFGIAIVGIKFISNKPFGNGTISTPFIVVTFGSVTSFIASMSSEAMKVPGTAANGLPALISLFDAERTVPARESVRRPDSCASILLLSALDSADFESSRRSCWFSIRASASSFA